MKYDATLYFKIDDDGKLALGTPKDCMFPDVELVVTVEPWGPLGEDGDFQIEEIDLYLGPGKARRLIGATFEVLKPLIYQALDGDFDFLCRLDEERRSAV